MDLEAIRQGLKLMVGSHDFRNFCKMDVEKVYNFQRTIHEAEIVELDGGDDRNNHQSSCCYLQIIGQAFLWHQIRCITEILFMIGKRLEQPSLVTELFDIEKYPGKPSYALADDRPLVLHDCSYPNLSMGHSAQNLWNVNCQLQCRWEEESLSAARIQNGISSLHHLPVLRKDLVQFAESKLAEHHKKLRKSGLVKVTSEAPTFTIEDLPATTPDEKETTTTNDSRTILWMDAVRWLKEQGLTLGAAGLSKSVHIPVLQRSMGTTYEQKLESIQKNEKRRTKYDEKVTQKRKTREEDNAFYAHKLKQGGKGF